MGLRGQLVSSLLPLAANSVGFKRWAPSRGCTEVCITEGSGAALDRPFAFADLVYLLDVYLHYCLGWTGTILAVAID